jgi:hypothetical protein
MTNQEKYENWKKLIEEQEISGLSQREFCQQKDVVLSQFGYYRSQLRMQSQNSNSQKAQFTPIKISDKDSIATKSAEIKLILPNGFQCTFPSHIEAVQIKRLIEVFLSC